MGWTLESEKHTSQLSSTSRTHDHGAQNQLNVNIDDHVLQIIQTDTIRRKNIVRISEIWLRETSSKHMVSGNGTLWGWKDGSVVVTVLLSRHEDHSWIVELHRHLHSSSSSPLLVWRAARLHKLTHIPLSYKEQRGTERPDAELPQTFTSWITQYWRRCGSTRL